MTRPPEVKELEAEIEIIKTQKERAIKDQDFEGAAAMRDKEKHAKERLDAVLAATIPVAIIANAGRVTITGVLSEINPQLAQGFFHSLEGWIIFVIALVMLGLVHVLISRIARPRPKEATVA